MPQTFVVDQTSTFQAVAFLSCEPKMVFGQQVQEKAKDGTPKWDVQVVAGFRDNFGKVNNEVIKIGITTHQNPAESMGMYTPVHLVNFVVGVMADERTDKRTGEKTIVGARVWYRCDEIRPIAAVPPAHSGKG
jgi:hypothetical protein